MNQPLVHVLVINWNGITHLRECFDSLCAGAYTNTKFILLDNASEDKSVPFVRNTYGHDPRVEIVVCPRNLGWSGGNNAGLRRALDAKADYVFLLNNDTVTAPDALERLVAMAESHPELGALAPKMVLYDSPDLLNSVGLTCSLTGAAWDLGLGRLDSPKWNTSRPIIGVCGGACFLRVEALRKSGLLPSGFDIYLDDLDLCLRIWNAGYQIRSCPDAVVRHKFSATMGQGQQLRRKYYLNTRNRFWAVLRNFPKSHFLIIARAMFMGELKALGRSILEREGWRIGAHLRSWGAALAYWPQALAERRRRRAAGQAPCRFWDLVERRPLFFPGTEFPSDGWYAERRAGAHLVRPMSSVARMAVERGCLRLTHLNPYPQLGPTEIHVLANGDSLATLTTLSEDITDLEVSTGTLEFQAHRIFDADLTGERIDIGGWIRVDRHQAIRA